MPGFLRNFVFQRMKQKAGDLISPVLNSSVGKLSSFDIPRKFAPTQPLRSLPNRMAVIQAPRLPSPPVKAAARGVSPYAVGGSAVVGGGTLGLGIAATDQIENTLNKVGPAVDRFFGQITPQAVQDFGKEQESKGWGGALEMATPFGFLAAPFIPKTSSNTATNTRRPEGYSSYGTYTVGGIEYDINSGRPAYMPPGSVYSSSSVSPSMPAAERAYQQEKSRVAQQTAQDPELLRYQKAREDAKTQEEMNAVRDIGMQIWQQKYGNTLMAQPGGVVGMDNPLMQRTFGYQSGSAPGQQMGTPTLGPSPLMPQVDESLNPAGPNFIGGEGGRIMNFADPRFENMSPEEFQKLLNQVNSK